MHAWFYSVTDCFTISIVKHEAARFGPHMRNHLSQTDNRRQFTQLRYVPGTASYSRRLWRLPNSINQSTNQPINQLRK